MSTFDLNSIDEVITPCCDVEVKTSDIGQKLKCPACGMNLKQRKMGNSMGVSCLIKVIEEAKAYQNRALASSILRQLNRRA